MIKTKICSYTDNNYVIMIPIFYEHESKPAWRKVYAGTLDECKKQIEEYPESLKATAEENRTSRENAKRAYIFYLNIGNKKEAARIKEQYHL